MRQNDILKGLKIKRVTDDSRSVEPGDVFVAVRGPSQDGAKFIKEAIAKGARVVVSETDFRAPKGVRKVLVEDARAALSGLADNFYGHPSDKMKMIGVTGTNGKTTVTYIIENILARSGEKAGVIGTISHRVGGRSIESKNTTPGALQLQAMLSEMTGSGARYAVMEVSSHALDQRRTGGIRYDAAVFTNITPEHLDYHKTQEEYFNAKRKIFGHIKKGGAAVLNVDDDNIASITGSIKGRVITYGIKKKADITAKKIQLSIDSSKFDVLTPGGSFGVSTRLVGMHNVSNALAAAAACVSVGIRRGAIKKGIETMGLVPGRLESVDCGQPFKVFVDFAHTEDALRNVLGLLREVSDAKIITVFGCGGNRDARKRPLMGRTACKLSDHVIITSDNPRNEDPSAIIAEIVGGIKDGFSNYEVEADRRRAIEKALDLAGKRCIVVLAGKGHENCQIIGERTMPFDDREVAREILGAAWKKKPGRR